MLRNFFKKIIFSVFCTNKNFCFCLKSQLVLYLNANLVKKQIKSIIWPHFVKKGAFLHSKTAVLHFALTP